MNSEPRESLLKYDEPKELGPQPEGMNGLKSKKKANIPSMESKPTIDEILDAMFPAVEWFQDAKHYIKKVSKTPTSRDDVAQLQKLLDERLLARQARESGIDPIREELHNQCFDEIIRQVTIDCPERGLLLMRVRDELKMTISAYQTLYQSSETFAMRKQIQAEQGKGELVNKIKDLEKQRDVLQEKLNELKTKKENTEKKYAEKRAVDEAKRNQEIDFLKYQAQHLENYLKSLEAK